MQLTAAPLPALAMVLASRSSEQLASLLERAEVLPALRRAARHEEALQLLARLAQAEPAEEAARLGDGARDVVAYAASLGAEHRDLAERSASWLLQRDPRAVVPLYLAAAADADALQSLHPEHVLRLLRENAPAARQLQVLTHLLEKLPADDPALGASAGAGGSAAAPPPASSSCASSCSCTSRSSFASRRTTATAVTPGVKMAEGTRRPRRRRRLG